ncbi:hypothetical protein [Propionivibrio sp.]|uniref:hypothetical protein n=1 Tax=Propionivibrio sp. TaxID=2212460 RepID=UPI00272EB234|nr:hypothetical protein [Propionivibrio sp.]
MKSCYTVQEFCAEHGGISKPFFYKLQKEGKGPRLMKVGRRTLITTESAADWRKQMEDATNGQTIDDMIDGLEGV